MQRREELNSYRRALEEAGLEVTSRWLRAPTPARPTHAEWQAIAAVDREDVERAEALVLFSEPNRDGGGGRHVEFGMALALHKAIVVVGGPENLFQRLPEVTLVSSWPRRCRSSPLPSSPPPVADSPIRLADL
jgi:nucleoside 2-deoxyribosyltransferase